MLAVTVSSNHVEGVWVEKSNKSIYYPAIPNPISCHRFTLQKNKNHSLLQRNEEEERERFRLTKFSCSLSLSSADKSGFSTDIVSA